MLIFIQVDFFHKNLGYKFYIKKGAFIEREICLKIPENLTRLDVRRPLKEKKTRKFYLLSKWHSFTDLAFKNDVIPSDFSYVDRFLPFE